jgi:osmotically-inducible protein OsmY
MKSKLTAALVVLGMALTPVAFAAENKATAPTTGGDMSAKADTPTGGVKENVSDASITAKIKTEFAKDKAVSALSINVDTDNKGAVTLRGSAKSNEEKQKAESIAKSVKGVTSVKNEIIVAAAK